MTEDQAPRHSLTYGRVLAILSTDFNFYKLKDVALCHQSWKELIVSREVKAWSVRSRVLLSLYSMMNQSEYVVYFEFWSWLFDYRIKKFKRLHFWMKIKEKRNLTRSPIKQAINRIERKIWEKPDTIRYPFSPQS